MSKRFIAPFFALGSPFVLGSPMMVMGCCVLLGACQPVQQQVVAPPVKAAPAPAPLPSEDVKRKQVIHLLLLNGEYTLAHDQLLTPTTDNAFDYFRAALKLDPGNQRAKGGLLGIVMRYVDLARQAAARGNYAQASQMLNNARLVDPENLLIKEVSEGLTAQYQSAPPPAPYKGGADEFLLDAAQLGKNDPQIVNRLGEIARKLKETDSLAMIVARSDLEGRWIYQQMREALPGYRVRGDIQIGNPPRIKLVPRL